MNELNLLSFFIDPILRGPTIGCMLMCCISGLMGVFVVLRKQALISETLSHAAYPGLIIGVLIAGGLHVNTATDLILAFATLFCAFLTALLGVYAVYLLEKRTRVHSDAALCFVLSSFFGIGITLASQVQFIYPMLYKQALNYLYGQAATMTDYHVFMYAILTTVILCVIFLLYKELQVIAFDAQYAKSLGIPVRRIDCILLILVTITIIIGIRSAGVVLMSAMLVAPAVAARQFTNNLLVLLLLASFFGIISGFFGNYYSFQMTEWFLLHYPSVRFALPTGPTIVIIISIICVISLLLAPERGLVLRLWRITRFRHKCLLENILKIIWRMGLESGLSLENIKNYQPISMIYLKIILNSLVRSGWLHRDDKHVYHLTIAGRSRAARIIRLHRLWEVYLVDYLGVGCERVHRNAEEMEHILTPELEKALTILLHDPAQDPHHQPIPRCEDVYV